MHGIRYGMCRLCDACAFALYIAHNIIKIERSEH